MRIVGQFSIKNAEDAIRLRNPNLVSELHEIVAMIDPGTYKVKAFARSGGSTRVMYDGQGLKSDFRAKLREAGYISRSEKCKFATRSCVEGYVPDHSVSCGVRTLEFLRDRVAVNVNFEEDVLGIFSGCAKMTIFHNLGYIDTGVEIVPMKAFAHQMSSGVSYFEQFEWDLRKRGEADIDIPVLIVGIDDAH